MHPPSLIDTCMSFRIAQLQEVRTAPAAHVMARWQEGPVTPSSRRSWLGKQARVVGAEGPSAANVARPNGYALETGDAACDGWGWPKGGIEAWLCHCSARWAAYRWEMRKGMPGGRSRGGSGRVGRAWPGPGASRRSGIPPYLGTLGE